MRRRLVGIFAVVALAGTLLFARQGIVVTKDGTRYEGDVNERGETVEVSGVPGTPGPVGINRANVASITYADKVADDVRAALGKLDRNDLKSRIELAKVAISANAFEAARDVLKDAARIDPNNPEVTQLMSQVTAHLPPPTPATAPSTQPAVATTAPATTPATAPTTEPAVGTQAPKRMVSREEINQIRQIEWRPDVESLPVAIRPDAKRKFLAANPDITPADFNAMTSEQQAALMLQKGTAEVKRGITITRDPASVVNFKKSVIRVIIQGCASNACHGSTKAGSFQLFLPATNETVVYTDFLILQEYTTHKGKFLIDRVNPENSLLLQYMLPSALTKTPHPAVQGFRPPVRTVDAPAYQQVLQWINGMPSAPAHYDIDLSRDPRKLEGK